MTKCNIGSDANASALTKDNRKLLAMISLKYQYQYAPHCIFNAATSTTIIVCTPAHPAKPRCSADTNGLTKKSEGCDWLGELSVIRSRYGRAGLRSSCRCGFSSRWRPHSSSSKAACPVLKSFRSAVRCYGAPV